MVPRDGKTGVDAVILGARRRGLSDAYYSLLNARWSALIATIIGMYLVINALFAAIYLLVGGIEGARPGSLADHFFFSVQTMATIGYGAMHPRTPLANTLVTIEALFGLLSVAMATGVLFAKFARPIGKIIFSRVAVIARRDGVPALMFRVGNERMNHVVEASMRVTLVRNEKTAEGESIRTWYELPLARGASPIFALTWTVVHPITAESKLFGATAESMSADRSEIVVTLLGFDATLSATIHARYSYTGADLLWDVRFADILSVDAEGKRVIDFRKFHDVVELLPAKPPAA